jgi:hypothetical protein
MFQLKIEEEDFLWRIVDEFLFGKLNAKSSTKEHFCFCVCVLSSSKELPFFSL